MAAPARLTALVEPLLESLGFELVLLEFQAVPGASILRLYIDRTEPGARVSLADCEAASREVSALLDVEDPISGAYRLEVSSPGLDRLLTRPAHFVRFAGEEIRLQTVEPIDNRRRWAGTLRGLDDSGRVLLEVPEQGLVAFPPEAIERARVVPDYAKEFQQERASR